MEFKFKIPDWLYNILKWAVVLVIPAASALYCNLAAIWGWPCADNVSQTATEVCTFIGIVIGISTYSYNKDKKDAEKNE